MDRSLASKIRAANSALIADGHLDAIAEDWVVTDLAERLLPARKQ